MIIWQSDSDNLEIVYSYSTRQIVARYGQSIIDIWRPESNDIRSIVREGRQWVIDNRWNGSK